MYNNIKKLITEAILKKKKLSIQMNDTEEGNYIIFHPYAIVEDLISGESVLGNIEKHYTEPASNYYARPTIIGLKHVSLIEENFEPKIDWKEVLNKINLRPTVSI